MGPLRVRVNGEPEKVVGQIVLANGGTLARGQDDSGSLLLTWPNGAAAWVSPVGEWGIRLEIDPADEHAGALEGLLGNHDGYAGNDLMTRDGQPVDAITDRHRLYEVFGDSWRLSPEESLFDYEEGESTETFTIPELPATILEPTDLPDFELLRGLCESGGVTDEEFQRQCILDLGLTGQWDFGDGAAMAQAVVIPVPAEESVTTPPPAPPAPDIDIGRVTGVTRLCGRTIAPDGTLYASVGLADDRYELQAIDPRSGEVLRAVEALDAGEVRFAAGSIWVEAFDGRRDFLSEKGCSITRVDARSFEVQATIPVGCQLYDVQFVAAGDAIWFVDVSDMDAEGDGGKVTRIDPDTDEPDESVELPFSDGYLQSSGEAIFYSHFDHPVYRLADGAWESLGRREGLTVIAGQGLWVQDGGVAAFYTSAGAADLTVPIDGFLVAADERGLRVANRCGWQR